MALALRAMKTSLLALTALSLSAPAVAQLGPGPCEGAIACAADEALADDTLAWDFVEGITTEVGRQPYVIYNLLRTADAASPLAAPAVGASLIAFVLVYFAVFGTGTWYIMRLMSQPPHARETGVKRGDTGPIRTAGITPGPTQDPGNLSPDSLSSIQYIEPESKEDEQ